MEKREGKKRKCSSRIQHNTNLAWASGQEKGGKSTRREENTRKKITAKSVWNGGALLE
jgi:hypothetical protein